VIPNSRLIVLQKSGHIPQIEQPEEFNESLYEFLTTGNSNAAGEAQR
jgi:pimeloyl-ACP methyl ester carboxylesterase